MRDLSKYETSRRQEPPAEMSSPPASDAGNYLSVSGGEDASSVIERSPAELIGLARSIADDPRAQPPMPEGLLACQYEQLERDIRRLRRARLVSHVVRLIAQRLLRESAEEQRL